MKTRVYVVLLILGLAAALLEAAFLRVPGYMDSEYYYAQGQQLAQGRGFSEPFLWNYLDDPDGLPHPSHLYWMPLTSILSAAGMWLSGKTDFTSGRLVFFVLAALVPALTAGMAWRLTKSRFQAVLAGLLATAAPYYSLYLVQTDSFAVSMLLGTGFILLGANPQFKGWMRWPLLGLVAGLLHLSRADGILYLGAGLLLATLEGGKLAPGRDRLGRMLGVLAAYLVVMLPWYARNVELFGGPFSPASGRAMWIGEYNALFAYPASTLSLQAYLATGMGALLGTRGDALVANLGTLLGVQGGVFILPLTLIGLWQMRNQPAIRLGIGLWLAIFFTMTLIFPLAGARGGFFHSGAALQPLLWAVAPAGLLRLVNFGVERRRNWKLERARLGFGGILVGLAGVLSAGIFLALVSGGGQGGLAWDRSWQVYSAVGQAMDGLQLDSKVVIMVNDPPGFYLATGRPAVVIPYPGLAALHQAAEKYGAQYLVLEKDTMEELSDLYVNPHSLAGLDYLESVEGAQIYRITNEGSAAY